MTRVFVNTKFEPIRDQLLDVHLIFGASGCLRVELIVLLALLEGPFRQLIVVELRNQSSVFRGYGLNQTTIVTLVFNRVLKPEVGLQTHGLGLSGVAYRLSD